MAGYFGNASGLIYNTYTGPGDVPPALGLTLPVTDGTTTVDATAIEVVNGKVADGGDGLAIITFPIRDVARAVGDGTTTGYVLDFVPVGAIQVFVGGVEQSPDPVNGSLGWTLEGVLLTFLTAPAEDANIAVYFSHV